jgi:hypothetical protein
MSVTKNENIYFASDEAEKTVKYLNHKSMEWFRNIQSNRYLDKVKRSWLAYHGLYYEDSHAVSFGGEQGELANIAVNHYRNIATHMLNMVTASRPSFDCRAVNTDKESSIQAKLGNGLLNYYMREKRLGEELKRATEYAIVLGSGYIKMEWNATRGEIYDYIEPSADNTAAYDEDYNPLDENGNILKPYPIYEGDVEFKTLSPFDVVFDSTKETSSQHDWVLCRTFINRFDIAEKYPELREEILGVPTKDESMGKRLSLSSYDETEDIAIYEFFHKRTESLPDGKYLLYVNDDIILEETVMPYRRLPVYRIAPSDILGTPYGYTAMFDLLPLQDAVNSLHSTILTNQSTFGVQNILNPRGNDIKVNQLEGGLNFIEYSPVGANAGKPEAFNPTQTPQEIFNYLNILERTMETISGVNSVARGNPESSLKSGTALALVQSQALQFMSGLQQSYIQLLEDVGTGLINLLQDFANVPRMASIAGFNNTSEMREFKSDNIKSVNRVVVDVGNALMQTTAGRAQVAENLLQMGVITSPEQYLMVMNTGNLDNLIEGEMDELFQVRGENEDLVRGEPVVSVATDRHSLHIREHRDVLADSRLRQDPELVKRVLDHIQEHINLLQTTDPNILSIIGEQPLAPPGGAGVAPGTVAPDGSAPQGEMPLAAPAPGGQDAAGMPQPAKPPGEFQDLPQTPEASMASQTGGQPPEGQ